jgi:hypothetical protein
MTKIVGCHKMVLHAATAFAELRLLMLLLLLVVVAMLVLMQGVWPSCWGAGGPQPHGKSCD